MRLPGVDRHGVWGGVLAEKIGAEKVKDFAPTDYVAEYAYETTKELLEKGLIKETKEKKIAFEF